MEMKEYLTDLKILSDEVLLEKYGEYGLYNNYSILINEDLIKTKEILSNSEKFSFKKTFDKGTHYFNYNPGIIVLQLIDKPWLSNIADYENMKNKFNSTITLHVEQEKDMEDIKYKQAIYFKTKESRTAIKRCILDLADLLMKENVMFCLPNSLKWESGKEKDYSEMAKFIPEGK
jgi:hypothetical protein